jgi:putative protease
MRRKIELLAPGGDIESIKAAIAAGADAVYCGLNKFNARNRAENITLAELNGILRLAHSHDCQVFITLNVIILESEIPDLIRLLNKLVNTSIDGVIVQDLGLFYLVSSYFGSLKIHASTQLTTHNEGQIKFLAALHATRINLSRELNITEIKELSTAAHKMHVLSEVFVHGSYCISFSGLCYMSSVHGGNSANRGRCSQPCRDQYVRTSVGRDYPLNLKDNSAYADLQDLYDAQVDSLKIEGRIKKFHYVYTVVSAYRKQLEKLLERKSISRDDSLLYKVFNRDFSNGFLKGDIHKHMFIDNPRDHSSKHLAEQMGGTSETHIEKAEEALYKEKGAIRSDIKYITDQLSVAKAPLTIRLSGEADTPLKLELITPDASFVLYSEHNLDTKGAQPLGLKMISKSFRAINDTEYFIDQVDLNNLSPNLHIPFSDLSSIKNQIRSILTNGRANHAPISTPVLKRQKRPKLTSTIAVLISSPDDLNLCAESAADFYFQLPNALRSKSSVLLNLFSKFGKLMPWFPAVLIGEEYQAAVAFLHQLRPKLIVTDNTGIAFEANRMGIPWIAGPQLNVVNSYSLLCLKENFNCSGSFISNEINKHQIGRIKKPEGFDLYYSIYHPLTLMTSRQCLFFQVNGCDKERMDETCLETCKKSARLSNVKEVSFQIDKSQGEYNRVYAETHFLNTDIVSDLPDVFTSFFIDLRNVKTKTKMKMEKSATLQVFEELLQANPFAAKHLETIIYPTTNKPYQKGL